MTRKKSFPLIFILTLGFWVPHLADRATAAQAKKDTAPTFTLKLLNGKDFESSDLKGKVAVLKFVASY